MEFEDTGLEAADIKVETFSKNYGGFILRPATGVRVTHIPTGLTVECDSERSQHQNRHIAVMELAEKVKQFSRQTKTEDSLITELTRKLAESHAREAKLRGQILKMIDRWWPFVHGSIMPSDAARALYKEALDCIQPPYDGALKDSESSVTGSTRSAP